jgi:hypothetical protein
MWVAPLNPQLDGLQHSRSGIHYGIKQILLLPFKVKKDAKTRAFWGFSPKTRGQTIPTVIPLRHSYLTLFLR